MAIRTKEELLKMVTDRFSAEVPTDEDLTFLEDITDTINSFESAERAEEWKKKYSENDAAWRKRYTERFLGKKPEDEEEITEDVEEVKKLKFEDLFKEGE